MKIIPLYEGVFSIGVDKKIYPTEQDSNKNYIRPEGHILMAICPFVIKTKNHCILLDTGFGSRNLNTGKYILIEQLEKNHLSEKDIDIVLLSHLHADHIGSIFLPQTNQLTYPNAIYYIQQQEYFWAKEKYSYFVNSSLYRNFDSYSQICFLHKKNDIIANIIQYQITGGHTPYHQVFWIQEDHEIFFFGGDVAPQYKQMKMKINARYDYNSEVSKQYRQQWVERACKEHWTCLFYHDIHHSLVTL